MRANLVNKQKLPQDSNGKNTIVFVFEAYGEINGKEELLPEPVILEFYDRNDLYDYDIDNKEYSKNYVWPTIRPFLLEKLHQLEQKYNGQ